jgi:hypothetical protein
MISDQKAAAKARVRAKNAALQNLTPREYLLHTLCATKTHAEAEAILDHFERTTDTAARLSRVLDICDSVVRAGDDTVDVDRIHAAALGDDLRKAGAR